MTDLKFTILEALYASPTRRVSKAELLDRNFASPTDTMNTIKDLIEAKLLKVEIGSDKVNLTSAGANAFESAQEQRREQTESEKQYRFNKKTTIISLVIAAVTSAIALVEFFLLLSQ